MKNLLKKHFGYDTFRPMQEDIINHVLSGNDTLVLMPTGGGKSMCYQLPALAQDGLTLVISPLIALMKDQVDSLNANGVPAAVLNSSQTSKERELVMSQAIMGELKLLYLAPERVASLGFGDFLGSLQVSLIAVDEAHCISGWGHDFRPDYRNLRLLRQYLPNTPVVALTATATPRVAKDILDQLIMPRAKTFLSSFNRENLHYTVRPKQRATAQLINLLNEHKDESAIIYCFSRKSTEDVTKQLNRAGIKAVAYHAGLKKDDRTRTQERFIRDEISVIVATIAFGMGIDKPDVRLVVHMDLPKSIEGYYQETGRAGRDGLPSECILFYSYGDRRKQEYFIGQIHDDHERAQALRKLDDVDLYGQLDICRRFFLLTYFGEQDAPTSCEACDNCTEPEGEYKDATVIAQKILSTVLRTGERFGAGHVCDVLRGSKKQRIFELGHDQLSVYAIAKDIPMDALRDYTRALRKLGYLKKEEGKYPTLSVSTKGKQALINKDTIELPVQDIVLKAPKKRTKKSDLNYNTDLFEELRTLRKQLAEEQNVPPFVIFGDKSLHEMAFYFPSSEGEFAQMHGVGARKQEAFAEPFLAVINTFIETHDIDPPDLPERKTVFNKPTTVLSNTLEITKQLVEEGKSIQQIATQRKLTPGTITQHIEKLTYLDDAPDITHLRPEETIFSEIEDAFKAKGSSLTAAYKHLDEKYTYDTLRLARLFME